MQTLRTCSRRRPLENGKGDSASIGSNDGVVRVPGQIFSGQAIPADKALVIISNFRYFKMRASRDAPIGALWCHFHVRTTYVCLESF